MAEVVWAEPALPQLEEIVAYIALDKPEAAEAVARRVSLDLACGSAVRSLASAHGFLAA